MTHVARKGFFFFEASVEWASQILLNKRRRYVSCNWRFKCSLLVLGRDTGDMRRHNTRISLPLVLWCQFGVSGIQAFLSTPNPGIQAGVRPAALPLWLRILSLWIKFSIAYTSSSAANSFPVDDVQHIHVLWPLQYTKHISWIHLNKTHKKSIGQLIHNCPSLHFCYQNTQTCVSSFLLVDTIRIQSVWY